MERIKNFKKVFLLGIVFGVFGLHAQKDATHPSLPKSGKQLDRLIPYGWMILSQASGDLNGDGREDLAIAIQSPIKEPIDYIAGIEGDTLYVKPRVLGIYFGKRNGKYKKVLQSNDFIIGRYNPAMDEPFKGLQILPNGGLQIDFYIWPCRECTSWSSHEYIFRFQNRAFELVGYTESKTQRISGDEMYYSIDFQNKTLKIINETRNEDDEHEYEESLKKFELPHLKTIKSLCTPFEWEFQKLHI